MVWSTDSRSAFGEEAMGDKLIFSLTVERGSGPSSLTSSAVIMPDAMQSAAGPSFASPKASGSAASVDDDADSVISMSTDDFTDIEGIRSASGTAMREDQRDVDDFDFVDEDEEADGL